MVLYQNVEEKKLKLAELKEAASQRQAEEGEVRAFSEYAFKALMRKDRVLRPILIGQISEILNATYVPGTCFPSVHYYLCILASQLANGPPSDSTFYALSHCKSTSTPISSGAATISNQQPIAGGPAAMPNQETPFDSSFDFR